MNVPKLSLGDPPPEWTRGLDFELHRGPTKHKSRRKRRECWWLRVEHRSTGLFHDEPINIMRPSVDARSFASIVWHKVALHYKENRNAK